MEIPVYYNEDFLYGECYEKHLIKEGHDLHYRYKLVDDQGKIIQVYECKKCNASLAMNFYRGKQFSSYISFPHIIFKKYECGKTINTTELFKIIYKKFDTRMYRNFKAGLFSGFPLCCVLYFCLLRSIPADPGSYAQIKHLLKKRKYDLNYLLCPICEIRNCSIDGKLDSYSGECTGISLFNAIKSGIFWRFSNKDTKINYNKWALNQRKRL